MAKVLDGGSSPDAPSFDIGPGDSSVTHDGESKCCMCAGIYHQVFYKKLEEYANVNFRWHTFWKELVYHAFYPLTLPLLYFFEGGTRSIRNRLFWGSPYMSWSQTALSIAFMLLNCLAPLYFSPDIFMVDFLWLVRCLIIATKYGFVSDGEMDIMRKEVLPHEAHVNRTLMMAWANPIPLSVLRRQLLLAAVRSNSLRCSAALRLIPGASDKTVHQVMQQLSGESKDNLRDGKVGKSWNSLDRAIGFDETVHICATCLRKTGSNKSLETRWLELCMNDIHNDPELIIPSEALLAGTSTDEEESENIGDELACPALDLPVLLLAPYILQRASDLLPKKKFLRQIYRNPLNILWSSYLIGMIHGIIPFATRSITGQPSTFGGSDWYHYVVSAGSFIISSACLSAGVTFMLGGVADYRRRYFVSRLLNTLLKDGWFNDTERLPERFLNGQKCLSKRSPYHLGLSFDFSNPKSLLGWWFVRCLVQDFGLVFLLRVKYYAGYFALYCGLLMAYLVVKLFASSAISTIHILAVVIFDLLIFVGLLCLVVSPGGDTNKMNVEHGATIARIKMSIANRLDQKDYELKPEERSSLKLALDVLASISQAVYWDNQVNQVTFLGFRAGGEILGVIVAAGGAAVGIAAQQLTSTIK